MLRKQNMTATTDTFLLLKNASKASKHPCYNDLRIIV
uniref:Uncharacterized protein n=1 Tax=Arundo donax TaxID=35708 RepID=A0A0A9CCB9_ARUDO